MASVLPVLLLLALVATEDVDIPVVGPDRVQEYHACVGSSAYIPWPLNVVSRTGHTSTVIYLTFQRWHSETKLPIANFSGQQRLTTDNHFRDRLVISNEYSGVFIQQTSMDDSGTYIAQARVSSGQNWTRTTNLTVLLRPIVFYGRLNISRTELVVNHINCVNLTCGTLEYAGDPPVLFVWSASFKILQVKPAAEDFLSTLLICSPFVGNVTCSIAGYASICTYDHMATLYIDLPEMPTNRSLLNKSTGTQDLVLTIIMPILAVLIPLIILGVWVLNHLLKSFPQYRDQQQLGNGEPHIQLDIDDNGITEHTQDNQGQSDDDDEEENEQTQTKEAILDNDATPVHEVIGNNNIHHHLPATSDDNVEEDESKTNENKPLMNASMSTAV